jgi:hypothetical protein
MPKNNLKGNFRSQPNRLMRRVRPLGRCPIFHRLRFGRTRLIRRLVLAIQSPLLRLHLALEIRYDDVLMGLRTQEALTLSIIENLARLLPNKVFNSVWNILSLWSSPLVVGGDPSEQGQDGFPITHVGNDRDRDGYSIHVILGPSASSGQGLGRISPDSEAFRPGHRSFAVGSGCQTG